jgi:uncharacterized membrane protein
VGRDRQGAVISRCIGWRSGQAPEVTILRKFGVAIFPDEKTASNGSRALKELGEGGDVTVYASVVIFKDSDGKISVLDHSDKGSHATAIAALIGGLAGLPAGPLAVAMGAAGGALIGVSAELTDRGVDARFVTKISHELAPGKAAIIADLEDDGWPLFDARMKEFGGAVICPD